MQKVADKLQVNIDTLTSILTELVGVGAGVDLCVTYLTGINNSLGILGGTVEEMRGYVETNKQTLLDILSEMQTFDATTKSTLDDVLKNLISQGADLSGMKSYLATIKQNAQRQMSCFVTFWKSCKRLRLQTQKQMIGCKRFRMHLTISV